jgi:hypothetical protein
MGDEKRAEGRRLTIEMAKGKWKKLVTSDK